MPMGSASPTGSKLLPVKVLNASMIKSVYLNTHKIPRFPTTEITNTTLPKVCFFPFFSVNSSRRPFI